MNSWVTGLLFLIGLAISNYWAAIWAAIASALALAVAILYQCNGGDIANGLFGFSPVLTGIALGITFYQVNWRTAIWSLLGILLPYLFRRGWILSFLLGNSDVNRSFCVATWLFLLPHLNLDKRYCSKDKVVYGL